MYIIKNIRFSQIILLSCIGLGTLSLGAADFEKPKEKNIYNINKHPIIGNDLYDLIMKKSFISGKTFQNRNELIDVVLVLKDPDIKINEPLSSVEVRIDSTGLSHIFANGKEQSIELN